MDAIGMVASSVVAVFVGAVLSSLASFAFVYAVSLVPAYVALYRRRFARAFVLCWVVLVADLGLVAFPPVGAGIWCLALAWALLPKRRRRPAVLAA